MEDYYIKFQIDEMVQQKVFCIFREIKENEKTKLIIRAFPLDLFAEKEPKTLEMVQGAITGIYYERYSKENIVKETQYGFKTESLSDEDCEWIEAITKKACLEEAYDELLKPPTVDEQVEDFIKEFFENDETEPLEQKDFLAEFFADIDSTNDESTADRDVVKEHFDSVEEEPLKEKDFLAEFFAELEEDEQKDSATQ